MNLMDAFTTLSRLEEKYPDLKDLRIVFDSDRLNAFLATMPEEDRNAFMIACVAFEGADRDGSLKKSIERSVAAAQFLPPGEYSIEQLFRAGAEGITIEDER